MAQVTVTQEYLEALPAIAVSSSVGILGDDSVGQRASFTFDDSDVAANVITSTAHGLPDIARITFTAGSGALPSPLVAGTNYYVILLSANTFSVAATIPDARSDTAIALTPAGGETGHTCDEGIINDKCSIEHAVAKEIALANGYTRQSVSFTGSFDTGPDNRMEVEDLSVEFGPATGGGFSFTFIAILTQASTTHNDTSGSLFVVGPEGATTVVAAPSTKPFSIRANFLNRLFTDQGV